MRNHFEVRGDITVIFIYAKDGKKSEVLIDTDDLPIVQQIDGHWSISWDGRRSNFYIKAKKVILHRLITNAQKGYVVDHINHNTLDNRKQNLRVVTIAENAQNRMGATSTNKTSGILGVCWSKKKNKWRARIKLNGKARDIGFYSDLQEAKKAVTQARAKYMPYSQEALQSEGI